MPALVGGERVGDLTAVGPGLALPCVLLEEGDPVQQPFLLHVVVDEMPARPHPDLRLDRDLEIGHPLRGDQAAVGDAAGEVRALLAGEESLNGRVDPVRADEHIDLDRRAVLELERDAVAVVDEGGEAVADVQALLRECAHQGGEQVGAVGLVVGEPERVDDGVSQRRVQERPAVVPAALMPRQRPHTHVGECVGQSQPVQDPRRVGADLDTGADLAELPRLLVDLDVEATPVQRQRSGEASDAAADDADREALAHLTCGRTSRLKRAS